MNSKVPVIIADDHPIFLVGLRHIIEGSGEFYVSAEAENREQLMELLEKKEWGIVILDINMRKSGDGLQALGEIKKRYPEKKAVIVSQLAGKGIYHEVINKGADGYITKNDISEMLITYLKSIMKGNRAISPRIQSLLLDSDDFPAEELTSREREVLKLSAEGYPREKIAEDLNIAISTVNFHRKNIREKLNVNNLAEMLKVAREHHLI